jgi:hypothetical protein
VPGLLTEPLDRFQPDLIHAHHPFLLAEALQRLSRNARRTARGLSSESSAAKLASVYQSVIKRKAAWQVPEEGMWESAMRRIATEWKLLGTIAHAAGTALVGAESAEGGNG